MKTQYFGNTISPYLVIAKKDSKALGRALP